jgi:hypothetical protein
MQQTVVIEKNGRIVTGPTTWRKAATPFGLGGNACPDLPHVLPNKGGTVRAYVRTKPAPTPGKMLGDPTEGINEAGAWEVVWPLVDAPAVVPASVEAWRFKALLVQRGLAETVDAAICENASPEALTAWDAGAPIARDSPAVKGIVAYLNSNGHDLDLDELLTSAAKVTL